MQYWIDSLLTLLKWRTRCCMYMCLITLHAYINSTTLIILLPSFSHWQGSVEKGLQVFASYVSFLCMCQLCSDSHRWHLKLKKLSFVELLPTVAHFLLFTFLFPVLTLSLCLFVCLFLPLMLCSITYLPAPQFSFSYHSSSMHSSPIGECLHARSFQPYLVHLRT